MFLKTSMKSLVLGCIVLICVGSARSDGDFPDYEYEGTFDASDEQEKHRTKSDEFEDLSRSFLSKGVSNDGEYRSPISEKSEGTYTGIKSYAEEDEVTDTACDSKIKNCLTTKGSCILDENKQIKCECPQDSTYDSEKGCIVTATTCRRIMPKCRTTDGTCYLDEAKKVQCLCKIPAKYNNESGCTVPETICEGKMPKCLETNGLCLALEDNEIHCQCPQDSLYEEQIGCKIPQKKCDDSKPECQNTGGWCLWYNETEVMCSCPDSSEYEYGRGCKVSDDTCNQTNPMCLKTKGVCVSDNSNEVQCKCPEDSDYTEDEGCTISDKMCDEYKPGCITAGGSCSYNNETEVECECPDNSTYVTGIGCKVSDDICDSKKIKCRKTNGSCIWSDRNIVCVCSDNSPFQESTGCKVSDQACKMNVPGCLTSSGTCSWNDETKVQCNCPQNSPYVANKGCSVKKELCDEFHAKCLSTGGSCSWIDATKVKCDCPQNTLYTDTSGCKVPLDICVKEQNRCLNTSGSCIWKDGTAQCKCPANSNYEKDIGCKLSSGACQSEKEKCIDTNGYCVYHLSNVVRCECPTNKTYLRSKGGCVDDPCIEACGVPHIVRGNDTTILCHGLITLETPKCLCYGKDQNKTFDTNSKTCKEDSCFIKCGVKYGSKEEEVCEGGPFGEVSCKCTSDGLYFDKSLKKCRKNCSVSDNSTKCGNFGVCLKAINESNMHFCQCPDGATGSLCETTECNGKYKDCTGDKGKCTFDKIRGAVCDCAGNKKLNPKLNYCEAPCSSDTECKGKKTCRDGFCACEDGKGGGDDCELVLGCDEDMKDLCDIVKATCIFDKDTENKATCQCKDHRYYYDESSFECKDIFCNKNNPCKDGSECTYDTSTNTGACKCPEGKFYDYKSNTCEEPDLCLLMKKPCEKNFKCVKGKCVCAGKKEGDNCVGNLCKAVSCFSGGLCKEDDLSCYCKPGYFFNGVKCESDAVCISSLFKTNCTCPVNMDRKESEVCVATKPDNRCERDCGLGFCMKENGNDTCKCVKMATFHADTGKCILDERKVCGEQKLDANSEKCNCTDKFTQSDDGITCRLLNCADEKVKKECESQGATCEMQWKKEGSKVPGYKCVCPAGYVLDNGKCTDPCSLKEIMDICNKKGQFCYNSLSDRSVLTADCRCPLPLILKDGKCSEISQNAYLITNIIVLKRKYSTADGFDKVSLNNDLIKSLQKTFSDVYEYGYLHECQPKGDAALNCSVWINFKEGADSPLKRVQFQAQKVNTTLCDDCEENMFLWPPNLLLTENSFSEDDYKKLEFCSDAVKNSVCGNYATCNKIKEKSECSCGKGFRTVISSIQDNAKFRIQTCEDIDECSSANKCSKNTECVNIPGDYRCECKSGFKKGDISDPKTDKSDCSDLCTPSPCDKGKCALTEKSFDCQCEAGFGGSLCDRKDGNYASAAQSTVVVGAVLGTILGVGLIAFILFYKKTRKSSGSEDFMPAPRMDHAEMAERRPVRGVVNKSYE